MNQRLNKLLQHPLHKLMGVTSIMAGDGAAEFFITPNENSMNLTNVLHGGVIYTLCDVCAYAALSSLMDENTEAVTHDIHVSVMRSVKKGDIAVFKSKVLRMGKRIAFMDVEVLLNDKLIATAKVTKSLLSK